MRRRASDRVDGAAGRRSGGFGAREQVLLVGAGVLLLALAAWSVARADVGSAQRSVDIGAPGDDGLRNNLLLVALGGVGMLAVLVVLPALRRRRLGLPVPTRSWRPTAWRRVLATLLLGMLLVFVLLLIGRTDDDPAEPPPAPPPADEPEPARGEASDGATGWAALALVGTGAAVVLAGALVLRHRWRGAHADGADIVDAGRSSLPRPVDLEALDPRAAVRAAYAAARRRLATVALAARDAETPREYLARVRTQDPGAGRELATLTARFEVARFSHHEVTDAMKRDAIDAYAAIDARVRDTLDRAERAARERLVAAASANADGGTSA